MNDALVFGLLFCAIACGWWLGRRSLHAAGVAKARALPSQYYRGLNYLLDGRPDGAVDHFISALEVNSETLETHIALGNVLRRRGEVDRAIRIHENLLARPNLGKEQMHIAHLELARDYISAGLLDRAEQLLVDLVEEAPEQRDTARQHLIEIYRSESDWTRAIAEGRELQPRKSLLRQSSGTAQLSGQEISTQLAHFYCERARDLLDDGATDDSRAMLEKALQDDPTCVRASLELGRLEGSDGNHRAAIVALQKVEEQDADLLPEAIPQLRACHEALGEEAVLKTYLQQCLDRHPSTPLMIAVAEDLLRDAGAEAARDFLASRLSQVPSLRGLLRFLRLQETSGSEAASPEQPLSMLGVLLERLISERPAYRCDHCGFSAKHLLWFCPGCKYWGTFRTIRTTETE